MASSDVELRTALADTYAQNQAPLTRGDQRAELMTALTFAAAVGLLFLLQPPHGVRVLPAVLSCALLVGAANIRFDTPFGATVATQLAFVPLMFAVPVAVVPLIVVAAFLLSNLLTVARGRSHSSRLLLSIGNSWFAIGPCLVFALAGTTAEHASFELLVAALAAQFAIDFVASAVRLAIARDVDLASQLHDCWVYGVDIALSGIGLAVAQDMRPRPAIELVIAPLLVLLAGFARERRDRLQGLLELGDAYRGTALLLGDIVEADDAYTGEHCKRVVALCLEVGARLRLNAAQRHNLEFGALLHDVGKIAIPKEIINKPGKLDADEWAIIKTHTVEGQRMLDRVGGFMREIGLIVRSHHERWDGGGYPDGLRGEEIPLESRIITCCDAWNAMQTDRPYRKAVPLAEALEQMRDNAGTQFDPQVVDVMLALVAPQPTTGRAANAARPVTPPAADVRVDGGTAVSPA